MRFDDLARPPLDPGALSAALTRDGSLWREIEVVEQSPSTNAVVAGRARAGAPGGLVVVAEHQTSGRGRLDRVWVTPPRAALTFSFLVAPDRVPTVQWPWLPLLVGIAVAEGVRRVTDVSCGLKWPNDVLVGEQKVAGILVERIERPLGGAVAVVGIGLNVSSTQAELPVPTATSLALQGAATLDRSVVLRAILRSFEALYSQWQAEQGDPSSGLLASYQRRCSTIGQQVRVDLPSGEALAGKAVGVDLDGRLRISTPSGMRVLGAGDVVHVRPAPDPRS
jgi:BirA family biotin operon repressor/biotin-[acetyl-CoA-carboxylase] ligase